MLYKVGYFLNTHLYYQTCTKIEKDTSFEKALANWMKILYPNDHSTFSKIGAKLLNYQQLGSFGEEFERRRDINLIFPSKFKSSFEFH